MGGRSESIWLIISYKVKRLMQERLLRANMIKKLIITEQVFIYLGAAGN